MQTSPAALRIAQSVATLVGADNSLESINTAQLSDRALVSVALNDSIYMLRKNSAVAESLPNVVAPKQGGPGRWFIYPGGALGAVTSVFTRTGDVVAVAGDYNTDEVDNVSSVLAGAGSTSDALDFLLASVTAAAFALQPFRATFYVDPAFVGVSTGSQSNPFTSIAAAQTYAVAQAITEYIITIPPGVTITENVVFPDTGGHVEIKSEEGFSGSTVGSRITGSITCNITSGVLRAKLTNIIVTGNITGLAATGTLGLFQLTAVRHNGSITLTTAGTGAWASFFRGIGAPVASKTGGSNTLLVSVAGVINAENWVFEGGITEAPASATTPYPGSQFQMCWFGSISGSPIPIGLNGLTLNAAFYDCIFVGPTTFTAGASNYVIFIDGASLASLNHPIAGAILVGTGILLKTINANASDRRTLANNLGSTAFGGRNADGLYEVCFDQTLLAAGTAGALQLNVIYTDMTGTLVTVAVGGALVITAAVGTKNAGSLFFRHNGAAAPIAFSYTGIVTPGAMSVAASVALMCRN